MNGLFARKNIRKPGLFIYIYLYCTGMHLFPEDFLLNQYLEVLSLGVTQQPQYFGQALACACFFHLRLLESSNMKVCTQWIRKNIYTISHY